MLRACLDTSQNATLLQHCKTLLFCLYSKVMLLIIMMIIHKFFQAPFADYYMFPSSQSK